MKFEPEDFKQLLYPYGRTGLKRMTLIANNKLSKFFNSDLMMDVIFYLDNTGGLGTRELASKLEKMAKEVEDEV